MSVYATCYQWIPKKQEFRELQLVGEFHGRPSYQDVETGEIYCPFRQDIPAYPPRPESPEYSLWERIKRYISEVMKRIRG